MSASSDRRKAGRRVLRARDIMNHGGLHWGQGAMVEVLDEISKAATQARREHGYASVEYKEAVQHENEASMHRDPRTCQFCAIGGLRTAVAGIEMADTLVRRRYPEYRIALIALVKAIAAQHGEEYLVSYRPVMRDYTTRDGTETIESLDEALAKAAVVSMEDEIVGWNDSYDRTWNEVDKVFVAAGNSLLPPSERRVA